ncbi:hypothetical protein ACEWPM_001955 [Roseovarius sp. S4756]|uniref:hypothetical protein n=1 Tax=Roseovarius maritimus TaxID=3342637 RepID=UPI003B67CD77
MPTSRRRSSGQSKEQKLIEAVEDGFDAQVDLTADLVRFPSTRGNEAPAQDFMAGQMRARG